MTPSLFWVSLIALTVFALLLRCPICAIFGFIALAFQFLVGWILMAISLAVGLYCLSGDHAMTITRTIGIGAVLYGLACLGGSVGLFLSSSPDMEDTTLGARFATRRDLKRAGLLRKSLDV
jgi:hypothetical protein